MIGASMSEIHLSPQQERAITLALSGKKDGEIAKAARAIKTGQPGTG